MITRLPILVLTKARSSKSEKKQAKISSTMVWLTSPRKEDSITSKWDKEITCMSSKLKIKINLYKNSVKS